MVAKNYWLIKVKQCFWALVLTVVLIEMLRYFRYYSRLRIRFGHKFLYCLVVERVIAILIFCIKLPLSYDVYTTLQPFQDGSLAANSNAAVVYVWLSTTPSIWCVFFLVNTYFVFQLVLLVLIVVVQLWIWYYLELREWRKEDRKRHVKRCLSGMNEPLNDVEKRSLSNLGYKTNNKMIGFGCYGTTYECSSITTGAKLALKVVDVVEWTASRNPGADTHEIQWYVQETRRKYVRFIVKLRGLSNRNVVRFVKIHNEENDFKRIYLITELAEMNLDKFLTDKRPNGVPVNWAREWFSQLCNGLFYLHEVFVADSDFAHSNIKPENILLYRKYNSDYEYERSRFQFGSAKPPDFSTNEVKYKYVLKLSDAGLDSFLPLNGKVVTKRNPILMISAPKKVVGKRNLRILSSNQRNDTKKFDDIYQMGVILLLLLKGDIRKLFKGPSDTERIHNHVTGVDAIYIRFDKLAIIKKLLKSVDPSPQLIQLLRKMMEWEPLLRYDIHQVLLSDWMKQKED